MHLLARLAPGLIHEDTKHSTNAEMQNTRRLQGNSTIILEEVSLMSSPPRASLAPNQHHMDSIPNLSFTTAWTRTVSPPPKTSHFRHNHPSILTLGMNLSVHTIVDTKTSLASYFNHLLSASSSWSSFVVCGYTRNFYIYSNCADPGMHFVKTFTKRSSVARYAGVLH